MKFVGKLNIIFLAAIMLLVPLADIVGAGCHSHSHVNLTGSHDAGNAKNSITSTDYHHCHPNANPRKRKLGTSSLL